MRLDHVPLIAIATVASGCQGNAWTASDAHSAIDAVHAQMMIETICADDDASACKPSEVRALERMSYCADASMLVRHGVGAPDAGITCEARR